MIEVHPVSDLETCMALYREAGLDFAAGDFAVAAYDGPERLGYCLFSLDDKGITVRALEPQNDLPLADGILRSALFVASQRGIRDAFYSIDAPEALFVALEFVSDAKEKRLNLGKLTEGCACGQS